MTDRTDAPAPAPSPDEVRELVERLNALHVMDEVHSDNKLGREAAAMLTRLAATVEELRADSRKWFDEYAAAEARAAELEGHVAACQELLRDLLSMSAWQGATDADWTAAWDRADALLTAPAAARHREEIRRPLVEALEKIARRVNGNANLPGDDGHFTRGYNMANDDCRAIARAALADKGEQP